MTDSDRTSHEHITYSTKATDDLVCWRCPHCGQLLFSTLDLALPARCGICKQHTQWEAFEQSLSRWRCPNCGQTLFTAPDDAPPDMCHYCSDMTTWVKT